VAGGAITFVDANTGCTRLEIGGKVSCQRIELPRSDTSRDKDAALIVE